MWNSAEIRRVIDCQRSSEWSRITFMCGALIHVIHLNFSNQWLVFRQALVFTPLVALMSGDDPELMSSAALAIGSLGVDQENKVTIYALIISSALLYKFIWVIPIRGWMCFLAIHFIQVEIRMRGGHQILVNLLTSPNPHVAETVYCSLACWYIHVERLFGPFGSVHLRRIQITILCCKPIQSKLLYPFNFFLFRILFMLLNW